MASNGEEYWRRPIYLVRLLFLLNRGLSVLLSCISRGSLLLHPLQQLSLLLCILKDLNLIYISDQDALVAVLLSWYRAVALRAPRLLFLFLLLLALDLLHRLHRELDNVARDRGLSGLLRSGLVFRL